MGKWTEVRYLKTINLLKINDVKHHTRSRGLMPACVRPPTNC
jgi:hypothetical protein